MLGALVGDIVGSVFERAPHKSKEFDFISEKSRFTDDSVLTLATADAILHGYGYMEVFKYWGRCYPHAGYGERFFRWCLSDEKEQGESFGNGSAMRVSPVAWAFDTLDEVLAEAKKSAEPSHNHPEGIKGASAVAAAIFLATYAITGRDDYNGLSVTLLYDAMDGDGIPYLSFLLKAILVFLSIAAGFVGGEVVPLIVTGGTFGYAVASAAGFETAPFAVLGAIGMLSGGTNLPLVCFALGLELFGYTDARMLFLTVAFAYLTSGKTGIYQHQHMVLVDRLRGEDA